MGEMSTASAVSVAAEVVVVGEVSVGGGLDIVAWVGWWGWFPSACVVGGVDCW